MESEDWGVGDLSRDREQREGLVWCCCCCDLSSTRSLANNGMGHRGAYYHATLSPWLTPPWCNRRAITISASDHRENTKVQLDRPSRSRHSGRHHPYWQDGFAIPGIFRHIAINSNSFMRFSYLEKNQCQDQFWGKSWNWQPHFYCIEGIICHCWSKVFFWVVRSSTPPNSKYESSVCAACAWLITWFWRHRGGDVQRVTGCSEIQC